MPADFINPTAAAASAPDNINLEAGAASGHGGAPGALDALPLATATAASPAFNLPAAPSATAPSMHHINITSYVPFKLDFTAGNYSK